MSLNDPAPMLPHWRPARTAAVRFRHLPAGGRSTALIALVCSRDSLTARLEALTGQAVQVYVRAQGASRARPDELETLGLARRRRLVWRREVELRVEGEAIVTARSVMALADCPPWVAGLGTGALGHQLFARRARAPRKSAIRRSPIEIACLRSPADTPLMVRRSIFTLERRRRLLVQEAFLPALIERLDATPAHGQPGMTAFG